jgi:alpha-tubulin suppressor-like RCC1 family protein
MFIMKNTCRYLFVTVIILLVSCSTEPTPVYTIQVSAEPGEAGTVQPASGEYDSGDLVEVSASAHEHWIFTGWSGSYSGSDNPVTITMDDDKILTANFIKRDYPLTIHVEGDGSVSERVVTQKTTEYEHGTVIELTAEPSDGWRFDRFEGDVTGSENPQSVTVEGETVVTAYFEPQPVAGVEITKEAAHMLLTTTQQLHAMTVDENGYELYDREVEWSSSNSDVVTVDGEGIVTAITVGTAMIKATSEGIEQTTEISIEQILSEKRGQGCQNGCGLTESGKLYCWGHNFYGEVGDGTTIQREEPVPVKGDHRFKTVSVGCGHTTALTEDGTVYSWGWNSHGQLGVGDTENRTEPTRIDSDVKFVQLTVSTQYTLGLTVGGQAWAWGRNTNGALGDGTDVSRLTPVPVQSDLKFVQISAGGGYVLGLTEDGTVYSWGRNHHGVLGIENDDSFHREFYPIKVHTDVKFATVSAGAKSAYALTQEGKAWSWGQNFYGLLGDGTEQDRHVPTRSAEGLTLKYLVSDADQTIGITVDGVAYGWGYNRDSRGGPSLGVEYPEYKVITPEPIINGDQFIHVYIGGHSKMGITESGSVYMWGHNLDAQLGLGDTGLYPEPTLMKGHSFVPLKY